MTTISIDWAAAASNAADKFNQDIQAAAGSITQGISDFLADPTVPGAPKLALLQQLGAVLNNRETLVAFATGQAVPKAPRALGGGSSAPGTGPDDPDNLQDQLDAAEAANTVLKTNQSILLGALGKVFGASIALTDGKVSRGIPAETDQKLDEIKHAAATSVVPANFINKAAVKAKADEAKAKIEAVATTAMSTRVSGKDEAKAKIEEVIRLVS